MASTIDAARKLITDRLVELEAETRKLERALAGIGETDRPRSASSKPRRKQAAGRARRRSQAPHGQRLKQLLAAIKAKPGSRPSELAAMIGIAPGQVSVLLAKARDEKVIIKKGAGYALKK